MRDRVLLIACISVGLAWGCSVDGGSAGLGATPADGGTDGGADGAAGGGAADTGSDVTEDVSAQDVQPADTSEPEPEAGLDASLEADVSFVYDATTGDADACAVTVVEAQPPPLAMYMILDRSGSMTFANKWETAVSGVTQFVQDPGAAGVKVALQFFPLDVGHDCAGGGYATPAVPMGLLPGNAQAMIDALGSAAPEGTTTPMEGALNGLSLFCATYASTPPGSTEKVVSLLVTDGMPDGDCDNDPASLAAIAASSFAGTPSVPTYVMGMSGADFTVLSQIAASGGTGAAYSVTSGGPAAFFSVMDEIRADAVGCSYTMPKPEAGTVDIDQVTVTFEPSTGNPQPLPRVPDAGSCGIGWYFDDNTSPTTIELCPSTCNIVKGDAQSSVQISLGCLGS